MDIKQFILDNIGFIFKYNTIISFFFLIITTLCIIYLYNKNIGFYLSLLLVPIFLVLYRTSKKNKCKMLFIYLIFSIVTFLGEALVIYKTNAKALVYTHTVSCLKVPSWLFLAYLNMVIFIWLLDDYFTTMVSKSK